MTKQFEIGQNSKNLRVIGVAVALMAMMPLTIAQTAAPVPAPSTAADSKSSEALLPAAAFEVVSIHEDKPSPDGHVSMQVGFTPNGTFTGRGLALRRLICMAYGVDDLQLSGGPDWLTSERYTIEAKADSATQKQLPSLTGPQERLVGQRMVQGLLADRFGLKVHQETKEIQILALVTAKSGPKMHESTPGDLYPNGLHDRDGHGHAGMMRFSNGKLTAQGVPLDNLASQLTEQLHRIVQNKTGLKGNYDFTLEWTPEQDHDGGPPIGNGDAGGASASDSTGPSIFTAIQEQLGLKLESQKGEVPALVIDHVERPSEN